MPTVKCRGRAGGEILTVGNELYQENKKASGLKGEKSTVDRTHSTGYFFCPKLEGGFIPQPCHLGVFQATVKNTISS